MPAETTVKSPVRDMNFNQTLDGTDLAQAMDNEDKNNAGKPPKDIKGAAIHSILTNDVTDVIAAVLKTGHEHNGKYLPVNLESAANALTQFFNIQIKTRQDKLKTDPKYREKSIANITASNQGNPLAQLKIEEETALLDLAETAAKTFPKGIKIDAKEIVRVMRHVDHDLPNETSSANPLPTNPSKPATGKEVKI